MDLLFSMAEKSVSLQISVKVFACRAMKSSIERCRRYCMVTERERERERERDMPPAGNIVGALYHKL